MECRGIVWMASALLLSLLLVPMASAKAVKKTEYGLIIDAGSSGSRIRIYQWPKPNRIGFELPVITEKSNHKETPGISAYSQDLDALDAYMAALIQEGMDQVPEESYSETSIYLMATAGMRLLLEDYANDVIDKIDSILSNPDVNPFHYESTNTRILSGEEEGVFAWISVNYLRGFFFAEEGTMESSGILEMGGASAQIAFVPDGSILADKFPVKIAGVNYPLYVHSYLYYGQDYAAKWVKEYLYEENPGSTIYNFPCHPVNAITNEQVDGKNITFKGSGDWDLCYSILDKHVYTSDDDLCYPKPCAIGTVYQPTIGDVKSFIGTSAYFLSLDPIDSALDAEGTMVPYSIREAGKIFCQKEISTIEAELGRPNDPYLPNSCLMSAYAPLLLTKGFGLDNQTHQAQAKHEIDGQPSEWTLGAIIYENERKDWECPLSYNGAPATAAVSTVATLFGLFVMLLGNVV